MPNPALAVSDHFRLQYASSVTMVAQQNRNALMGAVTEISATGEAQSVTDLMAALEYQYGEDRSRRNPENPVQGTRRWVVRPPVIESGQYIDDEDKFATATDPTSSFVSAHTKAVLRGKQDRILGIRKNSDGTFSVADGGIFGYSTEGKRGTTQTALPNTQYVPVGTTGLTLDKLRATLLALRKADFGMEDDDQLYGLISPMQVDNLIGIAAQSTTNQNAFNIEQLRSGKPSPLMGVNWILTNRLPVDAAASRLCPIFSKKNIVAGIWQDVKGDAWNDSSAKNKPYVYVNAYIDCVRLQDKGVVVIECKES